MAEQQLGGSDSISEATDAFRDAMDAESPSRSKRAPRENRAEQSQDLEEIFPNRNMDRRETEGGADDEPEVVRRRRQEARGDAGEVGPDDPIEGNDEDDEPDDDGLAPDDEQVDDEQEDEEPDDEDSPGIDPNLIVRVMVDGQPMEVSIQEALNGFIRKETFHQRLGVMQESVKALHQAKLNLDQQRSEFIEKSNALEFYIRAFMPNEPNWDEQYAADPAKFAYLKHQWDSFQNQFGGLIQHRQAVEAHRQAAEVERVHQFAAANRAHLAHLHPEWKSEKVWKRDADSMRRTAREVGYTEQELATLFDARAAEILLMASRYKRMMANQPRPVRQKQIPTKRNGATPSRNVSRSFDRAEKRLSRTGSINDAASVFERILDREG